MRGADSQPCLLRSTGRRVDHGHGGERSRFQEQSHARQVDVGVRRVGGDGSADPGRELRNWFSLCPTIRNTGGAFLGSADVADEAVGLVQQFVDDRF